jgi:hypothetical protein
MFTLCYFVFSTLTAVTPAQESCIKAPESYVRAAVQACRAADRDPIGTCEAQRVGAVHVYIRVRMVSR